MANNGHIRPAGWESISMWKDDEISFSTPGCGCCADGIYVTEPEQAAKMLLEQADELETNTKLLREWAERIKEAGKIVA